ncbi:uncharacterized protein PWA37_004870 [Arxiozyma heterogenica]|uniref:uncharacterized protein n=1 Tax=Arxiozyma heterogenica TaxID=278026 RepID=UPI002F07DBE4
MQIELTEEDICGYDDGGEVEGGDIIVYESKNGVSNKIKEMRCLKNKEKNINPSNDIKFKLDSIERELLSLDLGDKSESSLRRYNQIVTLYKKIHDVYHNVKNDHDNSPEIDNMNDYIDTTTEIRENSDLFDYVTMQRLTKLEQRLSVLEESIGFDNDPDTDLNNDPTLNIISRINKLYAHLKFIKNQLNKEEGGNKNININIRDNRDKDDINIVESFEKINKYSPYMDHIITRLESYSSIYDDMIENNLRLQKWDNKIEILIAQQNKWIELLDKIDKKLGSND